MSFEEGMKLVLTGAVSQEGSPETRVNESTSAPDTEKDSQ
jgi:hypothetical protein